MMTIRYDVLGNLLSGYIGEGIYSAKCEEEIQKFAETQDINVLSNESCKEISGTFAVTLGSAYEAITGQHIPNIFIREEMQNGN